MTRGITAIQVEAESIVEQVVHIYMNHTRENFIGLIVHGSAVKGGIIPGSSDIDFQLYLKESAFGENGMLPLKVYLDIHRDLGKIDINPFGYIQCDALSEKLPIDFIGPIPGAYKIVAGRLPVEEATHDQLVQSAIKSVNNIQVVPNYFSTLLDHGKERLSRVIRLLSTQVSPTLYHVLSLTQPNAIEVWQMPKNEIIHLLPDERMRQNATQFYEYSKCYYLKGHSVNDALAMIEYGSAFLESVKNWYEKV
jgi:hypothetical protein